MPFATTPILLATAAVPPAGRSAGEVVWTILALVSLIALAAAAAHPRVLRLEERLGVRQVITTGFPFVLLGMVAHATGALSEPVLAALSPIQRIGLGWIGFMLGFRFDARAFDRLPLGGGTIVTLGTVLPFLVIGLSTGVLMFGTGVFAGTALTDPNFLRDALILGAAGAITADTALRDSTTEDDASDPATSELTRLVQLEELAGVAGLAVLAAYFRPFYDVTWKIPGTAWMFLTLGVGAAMGLLSYVIVRRPASGADATVQLLGSVAFAAGLASYLALSPVVVCFLAGTMLANLPGDYRPRVRQVLLDLERPIYLLLLVVVGALWDWANATGWVLTVVFVVARFVGKWLAVSMSNVLGGLPLSRQHRHRLVWSPMGALPVAIVVNAQLLYPDGSVPALVTAVVVGAAVTEVVVRAARQREPA